MSYLGQSLPYYDPTNAPVPQLDAERFNGNASLTAFTMARQVTTATDVDVFVDNVRQEPITAYAVANKTLTFTEAPPAGTGNIYIIYRNSYGNQTFATLPDGSITFAKLANNIKQFTVETFTGDGSTTAFVCTDTPANANSLLVSIDGVVQNATTNFALATKTITFTSAPASAAAIVVKFLGFRTDVAVSALSAGSVTTAALADNSVTAAKIAPGTIVDSDIADNAVTTAKILNANVTTAKIADANVTTAKITDANVTAGKLAANAVTTAKIADDAVTLAKMAPGTDGNIISYDASGNPVAVATGSSGQVLTSAGAGAPPTFAAVPSSTPSTYVLTYLMVAGGGSGGKNGGGNAGGGAGGYRTSTFNAAVGTVYTATVGAGGAAQTSSHEGADGTPSSISSQIGVANITVQGGGGGGSDTDSSNGQGDGRAGGSGGGAYGYPTVTTSAGNSRNESSHEPGPGTAGQGNAGGQGYSNNTAWTSSGGGGGAGGFGLDAASGGGAGGAGGVGLASSITGSSVFRAGGGGGGGANTGGAGGAGGNGGGGAGGNGNTATVGTAGTANTGGGGGGGGASQNSGAGGSGVVIISVPTGNYSGTSTGSPTVTTSGGNTILQFNSTGTYTG